MDRGIALALKSDKICSIPQEELMKQVNDLLLSVYMMVGFSAPNKNDLGALTAKITSDLTQIHGGLSIKELSICLENGCKDEYGEFMGINLRTITKWIKSYKTSEKRYRTILEMENTKKALPPPGPEYDDKKMKEMCLRYFDSYKKTGDPGIACGTIYQHLQRIGLIKQSPEMKIDALTKARASLNTTNNLAISPDFLENRARFEAMKTCLKIYFKDLVDKDQELEKIIP